MKSKKVEFYYKKGQVILLSILYSFILFGVFSLSPNLFIIFIVLLVIVLFATSSDTDFFLILAKNPG